MFVASVPLGLSTSTYCVEKCSFLNPFTYAVAGSTPIANLSADPPFPDKNNPPFPAVSSKCSRIFNSIGCTL